MPRDLRRRPRVQRGGEPAAPRRGAPGRPPLPRPSLRGDLRRRRQHRRQPRSAPPDRLARSGGADRLPEEKRGPVGGPGRGIPRGPRRPRRHPRRRPPERPGGHPRAPRPSGRMGRGLRRAGRPPGRVAAPDLLPPRLPRAQPADPRVDRRRRLHPARLPGRIPAADSPVHGHAPLPADAAQAGGGADHRSARPPPATAARTIQIQHPQPHLAVAGRSLCRALDAEALDRPPRA